ncbi:DUF3168 domain-containing protein [Pararhizobium antarcticum]|uniref:DUF3168 domain-containing protein n=1 Tax=Pararhizobium antarcticum TaxID=1798805 RepID=A0A657LVM2_9HYPH|nr:DUF3168 domain-containing protein [Pararhizobium antarcticum]OJF95897.1 hypothetical protein AX760_18895 [Pararhizobium antarcticum]OJF99339.1 hypothetical protein AX761_11530 [Rhizobium sp. 58]
MSAAQALQAAIYARLSEDAVLTALIGTDGVHDRLLLRRDEPHVRFAGIETRDWSTASEPGEEHIVTLEVRSGEGGHRVTQAIAARLHALIDDAALPLSGAVLVNLRHQKTRFVRDAKARGHLAEMMFRAVTE